MIIFLKIKFVYKFNKNPKNKLIKKNIKMNIFKIKNTCFL